jgi:protoporphyrinogen IX oxidase
MQFYPYLLALHIIAMVAWMAGMFYLPRLFVYHADAKVGSEMSETFKTMERRLLKFIMTPAMVVTWLCGIGLLILMPVYLQLPWMQAKLVLVLMMSGLHGYYAGAVRKFAADKNTRSQKFWRWMNEAPTLLLIAIVVLVVVKP